MTTNKNLAKIFEIFPAAAAILLPDTPVFTVVDANNAYLRITSFTRENLIGRGYFEAFPQNYTSGLPEMEEVLRTKKPYCVPTRLYDYTEPGSAVTDHRFFDVLITPVLDDAGEVEFILRSVTDVTEVMATRRVQEDTQHQFQSLVQTVEGVVWEANANTFQFTFVSDNVKAILGYTPQQWLNEPEFWQRHIYAQDRDWAIDYCHVQTLQCRNHTFDYRMLKADGSLVWIKDIVTVIIEDGKPALLRGIMVDITSAKRLTELDRLEKKVLELNAQKGVALQKVLSVYLQGIEDLFPKMHCSILRLKNNRLQNWASPTLPPAYVQSLENLEIGPNTGSCGTSAYLKEKVIVSDIATDPVWEDYKQLALPYNLLACWSHPIINSEGVVMAVLGIYYNEIKNPRDEELDIIDRTAAILKVVLENRFNYDIAQETTLLMEQGQELANFGNWRWDIVNNVVRWSDALYNIYGLDRKEFKATFEGYQELLHPDDREMVYGYIQKALTTKEDVVFEERIIRPNGDLRYLKSWGSVKTDANGTPVKMIGACLDITETKLAETRLKELHHELEEQLHELELSEKNYSDLFHLSPLPMWVFDMETYRFLNVNSAAIKHYGYSLEEFRAMNIKDIRPASEHGKLDEAMQILRDASGSVNAGVFKHQKKSGEVMLVEVQSNYIQFNGKRASLVLANDITERLKYTAAIEDQNKRLQDIAWIQSHVVRAPLARIMGLIELFKHYSSAEIDKRNLLDNILTSANELDCIVKEISDKTEEIWMNNNSVQN